jgi:F-type H+-transporting ATPase subunit epsilon
MANTIPFQLITPTQIAFAGDAELVIAVGTEGEEGILPSHAPFLTALRPGVLRANVVEGGTSKRIEFATGEGFMQALPDRLTVLVDTALSRDEIDITEARKELDAANEQLRTLAPQSVEAARERAKVDFATAKLTLAG